MRMRALCPAFYWVVFLCVMGCGSSDFLTQAPLPPQDQIMEIKGFEAFVTLEGKPQYVLQAEEARLNEERNYVEMDQIHLTFYKDKGLDQSGALSADRGYYYFRDIPKKGRKNNDIDLHGHVVFDLKDGTFLKTPEMHYENATEKVYSNAGFEKRMIGKEQTIIITGKSFVTDKNMRHWEDTGAKMSYETFRSPTEEKEE